LDRDIRSKGFIYFRPNLYWGDEWCCEEGRASISVPFYLGNKVVASILYGNRVELEGCRNPGISMRYVRHEAGHAFFHAFNIRRSIKARKIFGDFSKPYDVSDFKRLRRKEAYGDYVNNIFVRGYGQSHPEEDFAETFAEWLNPRIDWRQKYNANKIILAKFKCIEEITYKFLDAKLSPEIYKHDTISTSQIILNDLLPSLPRSDR
tara:strand:- start:195 stop:812 length:618 start_codon:yes stop_codon:yes gene_type:complete